ncbi:50S ribosomal protein L1 [Blattabacterium cuenoti]|uniref:50S ribosomal protein L1 n=1 Tax=Blattabacterium cuenoti TaxID=1653831 RepID=UPI00163CAAAC|nr:50S ribosomal protein L1 [Blattabacterium cuenoti]
MSKKLTNNRKKIVKKINKKKYSLKEAFLLIKEIQFVKFDASVDIAINLGINTRIINQIIQGTVQLPHSLGKNISILALVNKNQELEAKKAGADYVGLDYIEKIKSGWKKKIDIIIAIPSVMNKLGTIGKILGPKGLMPNPKLDTVSINPIKSIKEIKNGKIFFKTDRYGIIHSSIGKVSFSDQKLIENTKLFLKKVIDNKPSSFKGNYIKSIYLSSTMNYSFCIDLKIFMKK